MFRLIRPIADGERVLVACHHDCKVAEFDWSGTMRWEASVPGNPYEACRLQDGNTLVSLGPSGLIVELDSSGSVVWRYDMVEDSELERGWIAGIQKLSDGRLTYSDSRHDRIIEIHYQSKRLISIFHNPDVLLHPSTHHIFV